MSETVQCFSDTTVITKNTNNTMPLLCSEFRLGSAKLWNESASHSLNPRKGGVLGEEITLALLCPVWLFSEALQSLEINFF